MSTKNYAAESPHPLPCVVQVGFAGSRKLFQESGDISQDTARKAMVEARLADVLAKLPVELELHPNHFLVGISQIACGADTSFSRVCLNAKPQPIPHRIVLPEHREAYLSATGADGSDFSPNERAEAEELLRGPHIISERVVSRAATRSERFSDTNAEILHVSDVIVCLLTESARSNPGGTADLLDRAKQRGKPALEIRVSLNEGNPTFTQQWHNRDRFERPHLPPELAHESVRIAVEPLPTRDEFCEPLKQLVSTQAKWHQELFKFAAPATISAILKNQGKAK